MRLSSILSEVEPIYANITNFDYCIGKICSDTEKVTLGDVFVCKHGTRENGHDYIEKAYKLGARTFIVDELPPYLVANTHIRYIKVRDTSLAEVRLLNATHGYPTRGIDLIAVTGTNGKTSTSYMLKAILDRAGARTGLMGTVKTMAGEKDVTHGKSSDFNSMTTPSPYELFEQLSELKQSRVEYIVLEASSHALVQKRLDALNFKLGIFTNLSEDHLDYHKNFSDYRKAKAHLFDMCEFGLFNADDVNGVNIAKQYENLCHTFTYSLDRDADFKAVNPFYGKLDTGFTVIGEKESFDICCPIPGRFTLYNALAAASAARLLGIECETIADALKDLKQIPGRLERIECGNKAQIFIDYAHTPDALEKVLTTLKKNCTGKLISVFGCGGDREREKRPIMGRISTTVADLTVITSDNSRSEDPEKITDEIADGAVRGSNFTVIVDRREAIRYALASAKDNDTVLLAGKGHEDYEITSSGKHRFSEREIIKEFYENKRTFE